MPPLRRWGRGGATALHRQRERHRSSDAATPSPKSFSRAGIVPHQDLPAPDRAGQRAPHPADRRDPRRGVYSGAFLGHGGRYIWRTGPPDLKKNHDLFTLEHLDDLADNEPSAGGAQPDLLLGALRSPHRRLHRREVAADSPAAARSRSLPPRGATARRRPWARQLIEELTTPGDTIGEAVMRAKHAIQQRCPGPDVQPARRSGGAGGRAGHQLDLGLDEIDGAVVLTVGMRGSRRSRLIFIADWVAADGAILRDGPDRGQRNRVHRRSWIREFSRTRNSSPVSESMSGTRSCTSMGSAA